MRPQSRQANSIAPAAEGLKPNGELLMLDLQNYKLRITNYERMANDGIELLNLKTLSVTANSGVEHMLTLNS